MPTSRSSFRDTVGTFLLTLKQVSRSLGRRPAYSAGIAVTLALGIGTSAAMVSVVDAILLRPLPYAEPGRLVAVWPRQFLANQEIAHLREHSRTLDQVGSWSPGWLMGLRGIEAPVEVSSTRLTGNVFQMLGVAPHLGTTFGMEAEDPGNGSVVVLGYDLWRSALGADSAVIGRSLALGGQMFTVIGVMPPGFGIVGDNADVWTPMSMSQDDFTWSGASVLGLGRLAPGVPVERAADEARVQAAAMQAAFDHQPDWSSGATVMDLRESVVGTVRLSLLVLLGAVTFLLLIAGANVANLVLIRISERRTELAVRASLGASPMGLAGNVLLETLVLAVIGCGGGILLASLGLRAASWLLPRDFPRAAEVGLHGGVILLSGVCTVGLALLFSLGPALAGTRGNLGRDLRGTRGVSRAGTRSRAILAAAEIGFAVLLTAGAGLMTRTLIALNQVDTGFRSERLLTVRLLPSSSGAAAQQFWRQLLPQLRRQPGVEAAGTILHLPTTNRSWKANLEIEGRPLGPGETPPRVGWQVISPGYLRTVHIALLMGEEIQDFHTENTPRVILLNAGLAGRLFPGESPLGRRIRAGNATQNEWATIIGVVGDVRQDSLNAAPPDQVYVPLAQRMVGANTLVVRTSVDPGAMTSAVNRVIREVDPGAALGPLQSMDSLLDYSLRRQRMVLWLLVGFAGMGFLLGAVGVYSVIAFGTRLRRREIGIRIALGATSDSVLGLVVWQGVRYALAGVVAGLLAAAGLTRFLSSLLYGVAPLDPMAFIGAAVVFLAVGAGASYLPARRAAGTDPRLVLEEE